MNGSEFFAYMTLGLASGLLVNAGFVLQMFRVLCLENAGPVGRATFFIVLMAAGFFGGMAPVFILVLVIFKDGWDWPRMGVFVFWLLFSMGGSIAAFHRITKVLNPLLGRPKSGNRA